ncbi:MAG TPA: glycosyltransferase family 39 protein [Acidimicrobiales bacterium]|nr:glycosyltransferase family 39 protein [Acidimicrobiales bacterium]
MAPVIDEVSATSTVQDPDTGTTSDLAPVDRRTYLVAGVLFAVLMALSGRYGFHRDELYFLDCARHLTPSYVDQPVLSPLLARLSLWAFGVSLPGLRVWSAFAGAGTVVLAGLLAREFGGRRTAQFLAALGAATMPAVLGADYLFGPTSLDLLFWTALAFVVVRIGRTENPRLWPVAGAVLGLGLSNKHSIGLFAVALVVGIVASGGGRQLVNRWFVIGVVIAGAFTIPDVWWQATNHWPTIEMTRRLNQENGGTAHIATWVVGQFFEVTLALAWVWVVGIRWLWRSDRPMWRALVWAYGLLFVFFALTTGGKVYYLAAAYIYLLAAGAVRVEGWLDARTVRLRRLLVCTALSTLLTLPVVLPVLPANGIGWTYGANKELGETVGWPQFLGTVRAVWDSLPPSQRARAVIFTADYGEAGAINELGRSVGLPGAVSGHNNEWFWGPGNPDATTIVAVAPGPVDVTGYAALLERYCTHVRVAARFTNPEGIHNQEWGGHVYICTGLKRPWGESWSSLRHDS